MPLDHYNFKHRKIVKIDDYSIFVELHKFLYCEAIEKIKETTIYITINRKYNTQHGFCIIKPVAEFWTSKSKNYKLVFEDVIIEE